MALVASDVLVPNGLVDGVVFYPASTSPDVSTLITTYIALGLAQAAAATLTGTDADQAALQYVYYRAWDDVVRRFISTPNSVSLSGELSVSYSSVQVTEWIEQRNRWLLAFQQAVATDVSTAPSPGVSQSIATEFHF